MSEPSELTKLQAETYRRQIEMDNCINAHELAVKAAVQARVNASEILVITRDVPDFQNVIERRFISITWESSHARLYADVCHHAGSAPGPDQTS